ncbi:fibrous sheath-interacting protein 1 [Antennarius striatus]|uniref:fibrous sheath-interacting protein 1 n=1 Tax=Antennarius striatus TaxID=241820 RepID=UPI0035AFAF68
MEIIRGSLEDISRPASTEQTFSRGSSVSLPFNDRSCPTPPFSLVVLPDDVADDRIQRSSDEVRINSSARNTYKDEFQDDEETVDEKEDFQLQSAIEEMRRLDEILSEKICKEKEIRRQRKELQAKLWEELQQNKPEGYSECPHEALNTRLFLALEPIGREEEDDFMPVFETQVPDCEKSPVSLTESFEVGNAEMGEEQLEGSHSGASKGKKIQKDFVKRNIELLSSKGGQVLFTQAEKERLEELLQDIDKEEEDSARGADSEEDMWAVPVLTGQGYTPEPTDMEQLIHIDSKICPLLPVEEFLSVQSSYRNLTLFEGHASEVGWMCDDNQQPGEKVLQDIKTRRGMEQRLKEIQQQLESLSQSQEMDSESPDLTKEQLLDLLDEFELMESRTHELQANDA